MTHRELRMASNVKKSMISIILYVYYQVISKKRKPYFIVPSQKQTPFCLTRSLDGSYFIINL